MTTSGKLFEMADRLSKLTVIEAKELVDILENDYGIVDNKTVISVVIPTFEPAIIVEQTEFNVYLKEIGGQKLQIIKKVKELNNLNLLEAKALVESAPCILKEKISKEESEKIRKDLEDFRAVVEIK